MKQQMKMQKIICFVLLITLFLSFLFAIGLNTSCYPLRLAKDYVESGNLLTEIQIVNNLLVKYCIIMLVISLLLFITNCHTRRNYYISNYIVIIFVFIANMILSVMGLLKVSYIKNVFLTQVDFKEWKEVTEIIPNYKYSDSTFWFDINLVMMICVMIISALLLSSFILKIVLMRKERSLLLKLNDNRK